MGYYRGDYYGGLKGGVARGDYYRSRAMGDPGFLGFLGALGRGIVGFSKAALGIPTAAKTAATTTAIAALPPTMAGAEMIPAAARAGAMTRSVVGRVARAPITQAAVGTVAAEAVMSRVGGSGSLVYDPSTGALVRMRRRRMNVCNPKALRRSMRRVQGFAKVARRTIAFTHRVKMKKSRRRAA